MKFIAGRRTVLCCATLVAACNHTDPTGVWPQPPQGPFDNTSPIRLTYSQGTDAWPGFSQDGQHITYTYERLTNDNDRCLGVLPGGGGSRVAEVCAGFLGEATDRDGYEHGALSSTGMLAYTRHSGNTGGATATAAALYVAPVDSLADERKVFDLIITSAPRGWEYLLDPVWVSEDELAFIGAKVDYIVLVPFAPPDTIYTGLDIAKVHIADGTPTVTLLATVNNASALAFDPSTDRFVFLRGDSLFTLPAEGGVPSFLFTLPESTTEFGRSIDGVAAGGGKVWISWTRTTQDGSTTRTTSSISEVGTGGTLTTLHARERTINGGITTSDQGTWGRIAASPDGSRVVAEGIGGPTGRDLFLLEVP